MSAPDPARRLNAPNREAWLKALVEAWRPTVVIVGQFPRLRIACGFPSRNALGRRRRTLGQCWAPFYSADGTTEIFVSPLMDDAFEVAHVVLHEILHAVVGTEHGHRGPFKRAARRVGLVGRPTCTIPNTSLAAFIKGSVLPDLGPYPHARLNPFQENIMGEERIPVAEPTGEKTRLLKAICESCGYTVRVTRKWIILAGPPLCPCNSDPMLVEWRGL
jgi:hypothetical protein